MQTMQIDRTHAPNNSISPLAEIYYINDARYEANQYGSMENDMNGNQELFNITVKYELQIARYKEIIEQQNIVIKRQEYDKQINEMQINYMRKKIIELQEEIHYL